MSTWKRLVGYLRPYRGRLTPAQLADGMNAAVENGRRLLRDADLMLANERWATALQLAVLAIEEFGKVGILRGLALAVARADDKPRGSRRRSCHGSRQRPQSRRGLTT